jgi:Fic/DOC family
VLVLLGIADLLYGSPRPRLDIPDIFPCGDGRLILLRKDQIRSFRIAAGAKGMQMPELVDGLWEGGGYGARRDRRPFPFQAHVPDSIAEWDEPLAGRAAAPVPLTRPSCARPPDGVPQLLQDLVSFVSRDDIPVVAQAAVAHAQFETIHPFADGNGRIGRCLIHVIFRRRSLTPLFVPPVSVVLAALARRYIAGLVDFREGRADDWIGTFADALTASAAATRPLWGQIGELLGAWSVGPAVLAPIRWLERSSSDCPPDRLSAPRLLPTATASRQLGLALR